MPQNTSTVGVSFAFNTNCFLFYIHQSVTDYQKSTREICVQYKLLPNLYLPMCHRLMKSTREFCVQQKLLKTLCTVKYSLMQQLVREELTGSCISIAVSNTNSTKANRVSAQRTCERRTSKITNNAGSSVQKRMNTSIILLLFELAVICSGAVIQMCIRIETCDSGSG